MRWIKKICLHLLLVSAFVLPLNSQDSIADINDVDTILDLVKEKDVIENERIELVSDLIKAGNYAKIDTLFREDEAEYFKLLNQDDSSQATFVKSEMHKIYEYVPSLQDDFLFMECKKASLYGNWRLTSSKAKELLRTYPDSNRKSDTIELLKTALIKLGQDEEYLQLAEEYPGPDLSLNKFHYGQALFNLGEYTAAEPYLIKSALDEEYELRASAILGLIALTQGDIDEATAVFDNLEKHYTADEPYYDYVLLSKARLLSHLGEMQSALEYYQAYDKISETENYDVTFEIAVTHRKAGNLTEAKRHFELILESKLATAHYLPTLYNLVLIDQELNDGVGVTELISNYRSLTDNYFTALLGNRNLINEIKDLRNEYLFEKDEEKQNALLEQIRRKGQQIIIRHVELKGKLTLLDVRTIELLKDLELTFLERTEAHFHELEHIYNYRNTPKDGLIELYRRDQISSEESYVLSLTEELISDIENLNIGQFRKAYLYANQLYLKKKYLNNLSNLIDDTGHLPEKNAELRATRQTEIENINELKENANSDLADFPNLSEKQEIMDKKIAEFIVIEKELERKRKLVVDTYYEKTANKAESNVISSFKKLDLTIARYTNAFTKFVNRKNTQNMYVEFIALDQEFIKLNEDYKKRIEQSVADNNIISDAEFTQMLNARKDLYARINTFTLVNDQFKKNYKLYFNLGELATFIYPTNHNLIYLHYEKVLELNPDFHQKDVILYNLAYYRNQIIDNRIADVKEELMKDKNYFIREKPLSVVKNVDKYSEVIDYYLELMEDNESAYQVEAMFRLASLYFDIAVDTDDTSLYIEKAIDIYEQIYAIGNQEQRLEALFQNAWHKMAIGKHLEAIDEIEILMAERNLFSEEQANRYETSGEIIAYSLNSIDGNRNINYTSSQFVYNDLFTKFDKDTGNAFFKNIIHRKQLFDSYRDIIDLYNARSLVSPYAIDNPTYTDSIIVTLGNYSVEIGDSLNAWGEREYRNAYAKYGYHSDWYYYHKDNEIGPYVKAIQKGLDDFMIPALHTKMNEELTLENIFEFSDLVDQYANYHGFNEEIRETKLDLYYNNGIKSLTKYVIQNPDTTSYRIGIAEVYKYLDENPDSDERKTFEQNAYSWALSTTVLVDSIKFDPQQFSPEESQQVIDKARTEYLEIADRFYNYLTESDFSDKDDIIHRLLYYRGIRKLQAGDNEGARQDFLACDSLNISNEFKEGIYRNLADIYQERGDYDTSNDYFAKAKEYAKEDNLVGYDVAIYNNRTAKVIYLKSSDNKEDKIKAAQEMELIVQSSVVDEDKKTKIKQDAIALYAKGGDYDTAVARLISEGDKAQDINTVWDNYGSAVVIADSLGYDNKVVEIENHFMERFPYDQQTFFILAKRLAAVSDETLPTYNPLLASQRYREIYDRASQGGMKLDISQGNLDLNDYYFNSIEMKTRVLSKAEQVAEWVSFYNKFPNYQVVPILNTICQLYEDLGRDDEYLKYIKILYAIDNTSSRYPAYALEKLSALDVKIKNAYWIEGWRTMQTNISLYKELANEYKADGIPEDVLAIPQSLNRYVTYMARYEKVQEKRDLLAELNNNFNKFMEFISVSPDDNSRVKVNRSTGWNKHLEGPSGRISQLDNLAKQQFAMIERDIEKVINSELLNPEERREQIFLLDYAQFEIAKYVGDTIYNQIDKYLTMPDGEYVAYESQILNRRDLTYEQQDEVLHQYHANIITTRGQYFQEYATITIQYARDIYNIYINGFTEQLPRSEEIMRFLKNNRVAEADAKDEVIVSLTPVRTNDSATINHTSYQDRQRNFSMYNIPSGGSLLLEADINSPIFPAASRFRFLDEGTLWQGDDISITVKFNDNPVNIAEAVFADGIIQDSLSTYPYLFRTLYNNDNNYTNSFFKGNNKVTLSLVNNGSQEANIGVIFSIIYDHEKLYIHNNSKTVSIVSDNSWLGAVSLQTYDSSDKNWRAVNSGTLNVDSNLLDAFRNSAAMPIWFNKEGTTAPVTKYFIKEFDVTENVIECTLNFLAEETANIFLNGEQVGFDEYYFFAPPDSPELNIDTGYFKIGKNVLIIEVNSPSENNALLIDMKIKTLSQRG